MRHTNWEKTDTVFRGRSHRLSRTSSFAVWTVLTLILIGLASYASLSLTQGSPASAVTTVPTKLNFQGRLSDASGNLKANGTYNMQLRLYTVSTAGTAVWTENRLVSASQGVTVTNGLFSIQLGSVTTLPASLFATGALYLEVQLPTPATATSASPVWTEPAMAPRNQMATSAYAYNSETLDGIDGASFARNDASNTFTQTQYFNTLQASGELQSTYANGLRLVQGSYGTILRNDGSDTYLLLTASGDQYGSWNSLRPLTVSNTTGGVGLGANTLYVQNAGNVGIGNTGPTKKLDVTGTARFTGSIQGGSTLMRTWTNLAAYNASVASSPGAFVIKTNVPMASNTMTKAVIEGFMYDATSPFRLEVGGYYASAGTFPNRGYTNVGSKKPMVRLGRDIASGNVVIIIGDIADTFPYPKLAVTYFQAGHSTLNDNYGESWSITQETALTAYDSLATVSDTTSINASSIKAGTFGAGNYTITGNLTVSGTGTSSFAGAVDIDGSISGNNKVAIQTTDSWLRLNGTNAFASGIYAGTGILRTDGNLQVGASGATLSVTSGGNFVYDTDTLFANSSGNVGIGTITPNATAKLTVKGAVNTTTAATSASVVFDNAATSTQNVLALNVAGTTRATMRADSSGNFVMSSTGTGALYLNNDGGTGGVVVGSATNPNTLTTYGELILKDTTGANVFRIDTSGNLRAKGTVTGGVASPDYAENIGVSDLSIGAADVVAMDPSRTEWAIKANKPYDSRTLGVISTNPGFLTNASSADVASNPDQRPLALSGRVPVKVSTENGPVYPGDYLTSSTRPGYAMKATAAGAVIGRAMDSFTADSSSSQPCGSYVCGKVLMFIDNTYYTPSAVESLQGASSQTTMSGDVNIGGSLNVSGLATLASLTVSGDVTIRGDLVVVDRLETATLQVGRHIITAGDTPSVVVLGDSVSSSTEISITGNDTAGEISFIVGTDESAVLTGKILKAAFHKAFTKAPHVMLTPSNPLAVEAEILAVDGSSDGFTLMTEKTLIPGQKYTLMYWVVE